MEQTKDAPQHSPGPWTVRSDSHIVGPTGLIGEVLSNFDRDSHSDRYLADAHLIAAAPQMFDALDAVAQMLDEWGCGDGPLALEVRAAIQKAEGK